MIRATQFAILLVTSLSFGQFSTALMNEMKPRNIGPGGMSGRITAIDVVLQNPNIIYAGSASGGLWKSTSDGSLYSRIKSQPLSELLPFNNPIPALCGLERAKETREIVLMGGMEFSNP